MCHHVGPASYPFRAASDLGLPLSGQKRRGRMGAGDLYTAPQLLGSHLEQELEQWRSPHPPHQAAATCSLTFTRYTRHLWVLELETLGLLSSSWLCHISGSVNIGNSLGLSFPIYKTGIMNAVTSPDFKK